MQPEPTAEEREYIDSRGLSPTYQKWTPTQRGAYLAVHRGHNRFDTIAAFLGLEREDVAREVKGMFGDLLWDQSKPDPDLYIRD